MQACLLPSTILLSPCQAVEMPRWEPEVCIRSAGQLKLGDFGLARIFGSPDRQFTHQVRIICIADVYTLLSGQIMRERIAASSGSHMTGKGRHKMDRLGAMPYKNTPSLAAGK